MRFFALMIKWKLCGHLRHFQTHIKTAHPLVKCSLSHFGISVQLAQDRSRRIHTLLPHRDLDTNMSSCLARLGKTTRTCVTGLTSSGLRHRSHRYIFTVGFFFWQGREVHSALVSKLNREAFGMAKRNLNNFVTPKIVAFITHLPFLAASSNKGTLTSSIHVRELRNCNGKKGPVCGGSK